MALKKIIGLRSVLVSIISTFFEVVDLSQLNRFLVDSHLNISEGLKISMLWLLNSITAWKVSKYGVISGPYFPVFSPNTGKYGPEKTPYLDAFHAVIYYLGNPEAEP